MPRIAIIGAGGFVFPLTLIRDILSFPELRDSTFALMDIDATRLQHTVTSAHQLIQLHDLPANIIATTDRREALRGANYVIVAFQVGGLEAYRLDVEIPRRYGIDQTVGDTLGPGGVMRGLRTMPVLLEIAHDMQEVCPDALLIQYANPMAMNCWALSTTGIKTVGLCHSVQNTSHMLARQIHVPYEHIRFKVAGINHQAWFLEFMCDNEDMYPRIRSAMIEQHTQSRLRQGLALDPDHSTGEHEDTIYEGGSERVRTEIMRTFGYFHTESSHHASEYVPYFRKHPESVREFLPQRWDYYDVCSNHDTSDKTESILARGLTPSHEYGAFIIHSVETNTPCVIYGNVPNNGLITNLNYGCCVEVPCLVDGQGIQPTVIGALPPQCAALNRTNINVQELAVHAVLNGSREAVEQAIALDPLSGAVLTLNQIHMMVNELLESEAQWLPRLQ